MSLRFREKQTFYHSLGELLRSGMTFPAALKTLSPSARGGLRQLLKRLNHSIESGHSVADSFAAQRPLVTEMEISIVEAVERAGRLDRGLEQLSGYFGALDSARSSVVKNVAYPVFVLHFGVLALGMQKLVTEGVGPFLQSVAGVLVVIYIAAALLFLAVRLLAGLGANSATVDALLRCVPLVGSIRRNFAVSRFCATYEMQLGAGVNVMEALAAAGRASRSGMIATAAQRTIPEVLKGGQVGALLSRHDGFTAEMLRDFTVGEQTGRLDVELDRLTELHRRAAMSKLEVLAEWLPRLISLGVFVYIGFRIVLWYGSYLKQVQDITDQIR